MSTTGIATKDDQRLRDRKVQQNLNGIYHRRQDSQVQYIARLAQYPPRELDHPLSSQGEPTSFQAPLHHHVNHKRHSSLARSIANHHKTTHKAHEIHVYSNFNLAMEQALITARQITTMNGLKSLFTRLINEETPSLRSTHGLTLSSPLEATPYLQFGVTLRYPREATQTTP